MPRDPRVYITLHNGMPEHHKVEPLSDAAFRHLVDLWCWCSRNERDGEVPAAVWTRRTTPRSRRELLDGGLAEPRPDGVYMHDYLEHQRSKAEIAELREKRARAGSVGGKAKASAMARDKQVLEQMDSKPLAETGTEGSSLALVSGRGSVKSQSSSYVTPESGVDD